MAGIETNQGENTELPVNSRLETAKGILNHDIKELADGEIRGVAVLVMSASRNEDYETLSYISDMAQRMQSPAFIEDPIQRAEIRGVGFVAAEGAWATRPTPQLTETQIEFMGKIRHRQFQNFSEIDSETLNFLQDNHLVTRVLTSEEGQVLSCNITPLGEKAIERSVG
jgi:hypothetical protein